MKNFFIALLLLSACTTNNQNVKSSKNDVVYVHDTIYLPDSSFNFTKKNYDASKSMIFDEYNNIYDIIKKTKPSDELWVELNDFSSPHFVMYGFFFNEKITNEIIVLFFLKVYHNNLRGNGYLYDISCCMDDNTYLMLFAMQYYKISKLDPVGPFTSPRVYEWVINQTDYLKNPDIKKEVDAIKILLDKGVKPKTH